MDYLLAYLAAPASIAVTAVALALMYRTMSGSPATWRYVTGAVVTGLLGSAVWLLWDRLVAPSILPELLPGLAALAGLAAIVVNLAARAVGAGLITSVVWSVLWTTAVFVPASIAIYSSDGLFARFGYLPLDHGGAIPGLVAPAAAAAAVLLLSRRLQAPMAVERSRSSTIAASVLLIVAWSLWLVSLELAIDAATPRILLNVAVAGVLGIVGWLLVQRIHHDAATFAAASAGLVAGLSSITAGAAYLDPLWAAGTGLLAAVLSATFVHRRVRQSGREAWFLVGVHAIAPGVGLLLLGAFAEGIGMLFTGQPTFLVAEVVAFAAVFGYSLVVSALLWPVVRLITRVVQRRAARVLTD